MVDDLKANGIDAIICPALAIPAMNKGQTKDAPGNCSHVYFSQPSVECFSLK